MKSFISYLFLLDIANNTENPPTYPSETEEHLYENLEKLLSKEHFALFQAFIDQYGERKTSENQYYFKRGFQAATRMILESCNDEDLTEDLK